MAEIEHPTAVYFDDKNERQIIRASELKDASVLANAKNLVLYDESEQVIVAPRISNKGTPHFFTISERNRKVYTGETDPIHNKRVEELAQALGSLEPWSLTLAEQRKGEDTPRYEDVLKLPKYSWGTEIHRILTEDAIVRHDIFGQAPDIRMSVQRPWIAIEVVHTHFPEEGAFAAMLAASKRVPLIVLFDLIVRKNLFVRVDKARSALHYSRWTYLVREGIVWQGRDKTTVNTSAALQLAVNGMLSRWDERQKTKKD